MRSVLVLLGKPGQSQGSDHVGLAPGSLERCCLLFCKKIKKQKKMNTKVVGTSSQYAISRGGKIDHLLHFHPEMILFNDTVPSRTICNSVGEENMTFKPHFHPVYLTILFKATQ